MKSTLIYFWIFFIGSILNVGYSIYVFIIDPQLIAYLCLYFGVIYFFISLVCLCYYYDEKRSK